MPKFFIVESLNMNQDEPSNRYEGKFLFDYLTMLKEHKCPANFYIAKNANKLLL